MQALPALKKEFDRKGLHGTTPLGQSQHETQAIVIEDEEPEPLEPCW
jgi:hypothetical protein